MSVWPVGGGTLLHQREAGGRGHIKTHWELKSQGDKSDILHYTLLGHPRRGGLYRSARYSVCCRCGHSLRLGNSG